MVLRPPIPKRSNFRNVCKACAPPLSRTLLGHKMPITFVAALPNRQLPTPAADMLARLRTDIVACRLSACHLMWIGSLSFTGSNATSPAGRAGEGATGARAPTPQPNTGRFPAPNGLPFGTRARRFFDHRCEPAPLPWEDPLGGLVWQGWAP